MEKVAKPGNWKCNTLRSGGVQFAKRSEAKASGQRVAGTNWIDTNKGDNVNPKYRRRLVAKEFNAGVRPDLYEATPPSECLRLLLSKLRIGKMYADVSGAFFCAKAIRSRVRVPVRAAILLHFTFLLFSSQACQFQPDAFHKVSKYNCKYYTIIT